MYRRLALLAVGLVLVGGSSLVAQDAILGQIYGNGVHAYFAGDFPQAHKDLTASITGGSKDPRCYYFRGLCYLELGREEQAKKDFEAGAKLETGDVNKFYNVPAALERIQGKSRVLLETYRAEARLIALEEERKAQTLRYEMFQVEQIRVLEGRIESSPALPDDAAMTPPPAIDGFGNEIVPAAPAPAVPAPVVPAVPAPVVPAVPAPVTPPAPAADLDEDPFTSPAPAPAAELDEDPFK